MGRCTGSSSFFSQTAPFLCPKKKKKTTKIISYKATGNKKARKFLINNKSDIKKKREINYSEKPLLLTREGYASGPTTL